MYHIASVTEIMLYYKHCTFNDRIYAYHQPFPMCIYLATMTETACIYEIRIIAVLAIAIVYRCLMFIYDITSYIKLRSRYMYCKVLTVISMNKLD